MATTTPQAKQTVIVALVFTGVVASLGDVIDRHHSIPRLRIYIGCVFAAFTLTLLADPAPELASSFALLIAIGALFTQYDVITKVGALIGGKP